MTGRLVVAPELGRGATNALALNNAARLHFRGMRCQIFLWMNCLNFVIYMRDTVQHHRTEIRQAIMKREELHCKLEIPWPCVTSLNTMNPFSRSSRGDTLTPVTQ